MKSLQHFDVNGIRLHWLEKGDGEAVIFMPGAIGDYRSWTNQMDDFANAGFRAIALSRRFEFPDKYPPGGDGSIEPCISDLLAFIQHLKVAQISLVGHSYGGYICLVFAYRYPKLVKKLVLEEPTIFPYITNNPNNPLKLLPIFLKDPVAAISFFKMGLFGLKPCRAALARGDFDAARLYFFRAIVSGEIRFEQANQILQQQLLDNIEAFQGENNPFVFPFSRKQIRQTAVETLVVEAASSPRWFAYICRQLACDLPNVQHIRFDSPTHWLHLDDSKAFNRAVTQFLLKPGQIRNNSNNNDFLLISFI